MFINARYISCTYLALYDYIFSLALVSEQHVTAVQRQNEMLQLSSSHPRDETVRMYRSQSQLELVRLLTPASENEHARSSQHDHTKKKIKEIRKNTIMPTEIIHYGLRIHTEFSTVRYTLERESPKQKKKEKVNFIKFLLQTILQNDFLFQTLYNRSQNRKKWDYVTLLKEHPLLKRHLQQLSLIMIIV